ncbi:MAG: amidase family protein, partial [Candidatus Hermodarchaeota archaeon]
MKFYEFMAYELIEKIKTKEYTIEEIIQEFFQRIKKTEEKLHSFVHLHKIEALEKAKKLDKNLRNGKSLGKLYGLPFGIKDLICIKNSPTTCG